MEGKLKKLLNNAYSTYSNYSVSAIVVMNDMGEFVGVNVENLSYGATICAERNAICSAIAYGYKKGDFKEIHIMNNTKEIGMPCMMCRQVMNEFFSDDTKIFAHNILGERKEYTKEELCPYPFSGNVE